MSETIAQLEEHGYHHIECWCEPCHRAVWVCFKMIRKVHPLLNIDNPPIHELGKLMPCGQCGQPGTSYKEARQEDGPGCAKIFDPR
jgi:hypothetical protein